jgi:chromosome segregation ATPase
MKSKLSQAPTASGKQPTPQLPYIVGKSSLDISESTTNRTSTVFSSTQRQGTHGSFDMTMPLVSFKHKSLEADIQDLEAELRNQRNINRHLIQEQRDFTISTVLLSRSDDTLLTTQTAEHVEDLTSQVSIVHTSLRELVKHVSALSADCEFMYDTLRQQEAVVPPKQAKVDRVTLTQLAAEVTEVNRDLMAAKKHSTQLEQDRHQLSKKTKDLEWNIDASHIKLKILEFTMNPPSAVELTKKHMSLTTMLGTINARLAKYEKLYRETMAKKKRT